MYEGRNAAIKDLCRTYHIVEDAILDNLLHSSEELGRPVASLLVEQGHVGREVLLDRVANFLGLERRADVPPEIPENVVNEIDVRLARIYGVVPIESTEESVRLIARDPFSEQIVDDLGFAIGKEARIVVADPKTVDELLDVYYRYGDANYAGILEEVDYQPGDDAELSVEDLLNMAGETPIICFVNLVLSQAIKDKASDIHFEPFDSEFKIRYRIDGALYEMSPPPREFGGTHYLSNQGYRKLEHCGAAGSSGWEGATYRRWAPCRLAHIDFAHAVWRKRRAARVGSNGYQFGAGESGHAY